ncbi:MAG: Error-prone repair protein ImuA [Pedobacter sp.]|nr:MAG: Error-prone repair protein ImuA [Pedobacter sp.]
MINTNKQLLLAELRKQILTLQGFKPECERQVMSFNLGELENCFPNSVFPIGSIHEFLSYNPEQNASSEGFICGILAKLMEVGNACLWISYNRKLFPPAMQSFGLNPQQIIFIDVSREKEILWVMEEALKCEGLAAVIAELPDIDFAQSRRLQLAVEKSQVTGILIRKEPKRLSATACTVRWEVTTQPSELSGGLPGVGFPHWKVKLLKVRNGNIGSFLIKWAENQFMPFEVEKVSVHTQKQTG